MGIARRVAGVVVVLAVVGVLGYFWLFAPSGETGATASADASVVYCLSSEQRPRLLEAAASLRVVIPPERLADGQGPEFTRVCKALTDAVRLPQQAPGAAPAGGVRATLNVLVPIVVGAAITWLTGFWRDERTQSRQLAGELRTAGRKYLGAAAAQRRKWFESKQGKLPVERTVLDSRDELVALLGKVAVLRPGWLVPRRLRDELADAALGEGMNDPRPGETPEQRAERLQRRLGELRAGVEAVVDALERPWRWHSRMRSRRAVQPEVSSSA